jgi:hypothetical protein
MHQYGFITRIKFHVNPSSGNHADIHMWRDGRTYERTQRNYESNNALLCHYPTRQITGFPTHSQFSHCLSFPLCHARPEKLLLLEILITNLCKL